MYSFINKMQTGWSDSDSTYSEILNNKNVYLNNLYFT